jgi:predicted nicotinamide N-methyase
MPVSMKIFSLPKFATQSPRAAPLTTLFASMACSSRADRVEIELKKVLQHRCFLHFLRAAMQPAQALPASRCERVVASSNEAREALAQSRVNTSLRGTLFFSTSLLYFE